MFEDIKRKNTKPQKLMKHQDLIHKYFSGELSDKEQSEFDKLLENNVEFQEEVAFQRDVKKMIAAKERNKRKQLLKQYEQDRHGGVESSKFIWKRLAVAASVIIIAGLGWYLSLLLGNNLQNLYEENYELYPNTIYSIDRSDNDNTILRQAFVAYESGEHQKAIELFLELKKNNNAENLEFYLGQSYLQENKTIEAIEVFKKVVEANKNFSQEASWYIALSYLKAENQSMAVRHLETIIQNNTYKKEQAKILLNKIN